MSRPSYGVIVRDSAEGTEFYSPRRRSHWSPEFPDAEPYYSDAALVRASTNVAARFKCGVRAVIHYGMKNERTVWTWNCSGAPASPEERPTH